MPPLADQNLIRQLLEIDRPWAAYALADLAPGYFEHCRWFGGYTPAPGLVLLYSTFAIPVLVALGTPAGVAPLLEEISAEPEVYLSVQPDILPLLNRRYQARNLTAMWRMQLQPDRLPRLQTAAAERLTAADLPALLRLYADGEASGEAPDFFSPEMVTQGVFYGVRAADELVAAAGTHLYTTAESVGTVGNVYTRRDKRGQGLATIVTHAVTAELLRLGLQTIVLNVAQNNTSALQVYARLGFVRHCPFYEGQATLLPK